MSAMRHLLAVAVLAGTTGCTKGPMAPESDQSDVRYGRMRHLCLQVGPDSAADRIEACGVVVASDKAPRADLAEALKTRASLYSMVGRFAYSAQDYAELVRLDPRDATTLKALGDAYRTPWSMRSGGDGI